MLPVLTIPNTWQEPNITTSFQDRTTFVREALMQAINMINMTNKTELQSFAAATVHSDMVDLDIWTNQTHYKDRVRLYLQRYQEDTATRGHVDVLVTLTYGYTAARAYFVYREDIFLDYAIDAWDRGRIYAEYGMMRAKSTTAQPPGSIELSVAVKADSLEMQLGPRHLGKFMSLSSHLGQITSNQTYITHAQKSKDFFLTHFFEDKMQEGILV